MAEPYAPRSPDLSALHSYPTQSPSSYTSHPSSFHQPNQDSSYSFSSQQQPSYYNPPQAFQQQPAPHHPHDPYNYPQSSYDLPQLAHQHSLAHQQRPQRGPSIKHEDLPPWLPGTTAATPQPSHPRAQKPVPVKQEPAPRLPAPGEAEGIVVRTKFPVARIKRIVQADEDVGKVAQVTPVVVSKALELFMISLTLRAATIARTRGSKRLTASHLKQAVDTDEQFDFLSEIVARIPEAPTAKEGPPAGGKGAEAKRQVESEDEDWEEKEEGSGKARRRGRGSGATAAAGVSGGGRKRRAKPTDD